MGINALYYFTSTHFKALLPAKVIDSLGRFVFLTILKVIDERQRFVIATILSQFVVSDYSRK
jgi:hypothetical protein